MTPNAIVALHCINLMPKALRVGKEKGATLLVGGKAPIVHGALLSWVIVPFLKVEPPYDEIKTLYAASGVVGLNTAECASAWAS